MPTTTVRPPFQRLLSRVTRKERGQTLVLFAIILFVVVAAVQFTLGVSSAWNQLSAVQNATEAGARAGAMQFDVEQFAQGRLVLDEARAIATTRQMLLVGLRRLPFAIEGTTPEDIAAAASIQVINAAESSPWTSPNSPYRTYTQPVVVARVRVPSRLFFLNITLGNPVEVMALIPGGD